MSDELETEDRGRLRILRLNRPDKKNALNGALLGALPRAIRAAAGDEGVWAIALTGNGRAFCSGLDFSDQSLFDSGASRDDDVSSPGEGGAAAHLPILMRVECEKPIVAGVNGAAVGAGVSLALNADIRIAAPSARFHPGYTRIGVSPDLGMSWTLVRALGYERSMRFILEQRMVPAVEALDVGMVSEVVEHDDDLEGRLIEYGTMLADVAPMAARQTKRLLVRMDQPVDLVGQLDLEIELVLRALRSKDSAEAIRAMMAGEAPNFTGH